MSANPEGPTNVKSGILQRLPRISASVWLLVIVCLFLIAMIPLVMGYIAKLSKQQDLRQQVDQLQSQYDAVKSKMAGQASLSTEVGKLKAEVEQARKLYAEGCDNLKSSQVLMDLAWENNINVLNMSISSSQVKVLSTNYPALIYTFGLSGQVASFQNFLIAVGNRFPSSQYLDITITPATVEGNLDQANIKLQILCNQ